MMVQLMLPCLAVPQFAKAEHVLLISIFSEIFGDNSFAGSKTFPFGHCGEHDILNPGRVIFTFCGKLLRTGSSDAG